MSELLVRAGDDLMGDIVAGEVDFSLQRGFELSSSRRGNRIVEEVEVDEVGIHDMMMGEVVQGLVIGGRGFAGGCASERGRWGGGDGEEREGCLEGSGRVGYSYTDSAETQSCSSLTQSPHSQRRQYYRQFEPGSRFHVPFQWVALVFSIAISRQSLFFI